MCNSTNPESADSRKAVKRRRGECGQLNKMAKIDSTEQHQKDALNESPLPSCGRNNGQNTQENLLNESSMSSNGQNKGKDLQEDLLNESSNEQNKEQNLQDGSNLTENRMTIPEKQLQNYLCRLRQCSSHPYLIMRPEKDGEIVIDEQMIASSGKMIMLDRLLKELKKNNHRTLIFCQFVEMIDYLEDFCEMRNYTYSRLDGKMDIHERQSEMVKFQNENVFVFLLSTRAGAFGINLIKADTVIIFESDWNPQYDIQAQNRCHRIGQTQPVMVYRLVTAGTVDQRICEAANAKRELEKLVLHKEKFKTGYKPITQKDVMNLLGDDHPDIVKFLESKQEHLEVTDEELKHLLDRSIHATHKKESESPGSF